MAAKKGDTVKVDYTGKLKDGTVFDSSVGRKEPLVFTLGAGNIIPGFESAVTGMHPGESKTVTIPADEAYGPHHKEMVVQVSRKDLPPDLDPVVGQQLSVGQETEEYSVVSVTAVDSDSVTLDGNHPLAGKDLVFEIKLLEICPPCDCGHDHGGHEHGGHKH